MKILAEAMEDYLALRRGLGFKLKRHSRCLKEFASFLEHAGEPQITTKLALQWATQPQHVQPVEWAARLSVVRGFAGFWSATDPMTEIPPAGPLPNRHNRVEPYLYSDEQIHQILDAARNMPTTHSLQPWTHHCLFGLLAVTGLRISEALNLRSTDVDWSEGILTIRDAKFGKNHAGLRVQRLCAEEDCCSEDPFECCHKPSVLLPALGHPKRVQHLRSGSEANHLAFLLNRHCRQHDRYEAVLTEGQAKIGVTGQLKDEMPIPSLIQELPGRWTPNGQTA